VRQAAWINTIPVQDRVAVEVLRNELDDGESETIVLARELGASLILIDEKLARRKTAQMGLKTIGTLGILVMAKTSGLTPTVRSHLDALKSSSFRMTRKLYDEILQRAGE
jgi:predicted nucleic acid-binding protein